MPSHPVGLEVWFFGRTLRLLLYFMGANSEGSGETARIRRLAWAFAGRLRDKNHSLICWLIWHDLFCFLLQYTGNVCDEINSDIINIWLRIRCLDDSGRKQFFWNMDFKSYFKIKVPNFIKFYRKFIIHITRNSICPNQKRIINFEKKNTHTKKKPLKFSFN